METAVIRKRKKRKGIILSKKSKYDKGYRYVKAVNSDLFKILYTYSQLFNDQIYSITFDLDTQNRLTSNILKKCEVVIEKRNYKGFEGVVILLIDHLKKEIVTSKYITICIDCYNKKRGYFEFQWTMKEFHELTPADAHFIYHSCDFKVSKENHLKYKHGLGFDLGLTFNNNKTTSIYFGFPVTAEQDDRKNLKKKKYKNKVKNKLKEQYFKIWDEKLNLKKSPYLKIFNNIKN